MKGSPTMSRYTTPPAAVSRERGGAGAARPRRSCSLVAPLAAVLLVAACGGTQQDAGATAREKPGTETTADEGRADAAVALRNAHGENVGRVELRKVDGGTAVFVEVHDLPPGFHGFHIHKVGVCEPHSADPADPSKVGDFRSAGSHVGDGDHPEHTGDLSSLYVDETGSGSLTTVTDRFSVDDLLDHDGSAFIMHSGPDNFANIPERYAPSGPDHDTLGTGDAGDRIACGALE